MNSPPFISLPEVQEGLRLVGTSIMDEEQYRVEGWHLSSRGYWVARLDGLREYGRIRQERRELRIAAARARREADDAWSREIERQIERTP
jgi:hypothetical protein